MKEKELKKVMEQIQPEAGAQERMYANILKKAAQQTAPKKKSPSPVLLRRWGALAACLALLVTVAIVMPHFFTTPDPTNPPVLGGSPFEDVSGPEGFAKLDLVIDAPQGAEDIGYCILDGEIARVTFTLEGHRYTLEAPRLDGNFSGVYGEVESSICVDAKYNARLERLSSGDWRACWSKGAVNYYLTNSDGAPQESIIQILKELMA